MNTEQDTLGRTTRRAWLVLIAVTVVLLFGSGTTFPSMGIPLFAMAGEFHWSQTASGAAFLALGVVCAATSLGPMALIPRIGGRWTVVSGTLILAGGFLLASVTSSLAVFYVAAALFGIAFSLVANASGTYMIANWFGERSGRMIGLYMMVGSLGGAIIPPVAGALTASQGGWRLYWASMAGVAVLIAVLCALFIREPPNLAKPAADLREYVPREGWGYRAFLATPQFLVLAAAMVGTQFCTITVSAATVPHFANAGWSAEYAARILGLQGLVGSIATGVSGWLTERYAPKLILAGGLLLEAAGTLLLAFAHSLWTTYLFVPIFGIGWSVTSLAVTVLLIRCFGSKSGTAALSTIWMLAGLATAGPSIAGLMADLTGGFVSALSLFGLMLVPVALAALLMNASERVIPGGLVPRLQQE
jgi:MFS family permease